eukprot:m.149108 g.149108  ORF g.149108 m.149108 type:complete len:157 (-) comp16151_c0_seq1:2113-2583(-)
MVVIMDKEAEATTTMTTMMMTIPVNGPKLQTIWPSMESGKMCVCVFFFGKQLVLPSCRSFLQLLWVCLTGFVMLWRQIPFFSCVCLSGYFVGLQPKAGLQSLEISLTLLLAYVLAVPFLLYWLPGVLLEHVWECVVTFVYDHKLYDTILPMWTFWR